MTEATTRDTTLVTVHQQQIKEKKRFKKNKLSQMKREETKQNNSPGKWLKFSLVSLCFSWSEGFDF